MTTKRNKELLELIKTAAAEAADHQEKFAAADTESRKIVEIMERFLRIKRRVVYGGAAINAHLPAGSKFYDPNLYLPDYDFMTPDPLQDCADLITTFQGEGFTDVEAKFGIHEGTYKIFVNYRPAADITYMPADIYGNITDDAVTIDGIRYASVNYLRMNIYLELSRPAGDVSRWEKVYGRLLLLNEISPIRAGRCVEKPLERVGSSDTHSDAETIHSRIVDIGIEAEAVFLSGASLLAGVPMDTTEIVLLMTNRVDKVSAELEHIGLSATKFPAVGELLPERVEFYSGGRKTLRAVVFDTVACHAYITMTDPPNYRLGSLDLLIQMYYAFYFTDMEYLSVRPLCVIQALIDMEARKRRAAAGGTGKQESSHDVFPLDCVGHQPTLPELKRAHRQRIREKRSELQHALRVESDHAVRVTKRRRHKRLAVS